MKKSIQLSLLSSACLLAACANAQALSSIYSLGDSLSDPGAYAPSTQLLAPGSGKFTTNPGLVWTQYLGQYVGLPSEAATVNQSFRPTRTPNGGTNYAQGGARVAQAPTTPSPLPFVTADSVRSQIDRLLTDTGGRIDSRALVTVWAGANDVFAQYEGIGAGLPLSTALTNVGSAASDLTGQIQRLQAAGAKLVIVNALPDIGLTPFGATQGAAGADALSKLTAEFNQRLIASSAGRNVLVMDTNKILVDVGTRPAAYGFTANNAYAQPACNPATQPSALICVNPPEADTRVFSDGIHPTSAMHRILAQVSLATLRAPAQIATLVTSPLAGIRQQAEIQEFRLTPDALYKTDRRTIGVGLRPKGDFQMYTSLTKGGSRVSSQDLQLGNKVDSSSVLVGADIMLTQAMLTGLTLSRTQGDVSFSENSGGFKSTLNTVSAYTTLSLSPEWYLNAALTYGGMSYDSIHRDAYLGATNLKVSASGSTSGSYTSVRIGGGYAMKAGAFSGGPTLSLVEERMKVKGYTEAPGPTSLIFGDTSYKARRLILGFNGNYDLGQVRAYGRLSLERDLRDNPILVSMGAFSNTSLAVEQARPDGKFALATLGLKGNISKLVQWNVFTTSSLLQKNGGGWTVGGMLEMQF